MAKTYSITMLDGEVRDMTSAEIAEHTGLKQGTIQKRLNQQGMRSMAKLAVSPQAAKARGRRMFGAQSTAHFASNKEKREAFASRPVYRDWKDR